MIFCFATCGKWQIAYFSSKYCQNVNLIWPKCPKYPHLRPMIVDDLRWSEIFGKYRRCLIVESSHQVMFRRGKGAQPWRSMPPLHRLNTELSHRLHQDGCVLYVTHCFVVHMRLFLAMWRTPKIICLLMSSFPQRFWWDAFSSFSRSFALFHNKKP